MYKMWDFCQEISNILEEFLCMNNLIHFSIHIPQYFIFMYSIMRLFFPIDVVSVNLCDFSIFFFTDFTFLSLFKDDFLILIKQFLPMLKTF